jgi:nicotinamide-nucleotide amidase
MADATKQLLPLAEQVAARLQAKGETIAIAESSTGGLISAALLAVPGASAYFLGGAVVYTAQARTALLELPAAALAGIRPATETYARLVAGHTRQRFSSNWALAETGATGPTGNRYGDPAGHSCMAIAGPIEAAMTLETGRSDRLANMQAFTEAALRFLLRTLSGQPG